jgi:hypothetical protein
MSESTEKIRRAEIREKGKEATLLAATAPLGVRFRTALHWLENASGWSFSTLDALEAHQVCLELLDALLAGGGNLESRHLNLTSQQMKDAKSFAVDGAACAIDSGQLELALELLEQGRSMLLTQAGRYRTPVEDLERVNAGLAKEFRMISARMEASVMDAPRTSLNVASASALLIEDTIAM